MAMQLAFRGEGGASVGDTDDPWCSYPSGPIWDGESFSDCFQYRSLLGVPALIFIGLSIAALALSLIWKALERRSAGGRIKLEGWAGGQSEQCEGDRQGAYSITEAENAVIAEEVAKQGGWGVPDRLRPLGGRSAAGDGATRLRRDARTSWVARGLAGSLKDLITTSCYLALFAVFLLRLLHPRSRPSGAPQRVGYLWLISPTLLFAYCALLSLVKLRFAIRYATIPTLQVPEAPYALLEAHLMFVVVVLPFIAFIEFRETLVPLLSNGALPRESSWSLGLGVSEFVLALILSGSELLWTRPTPFLPRFAPGRLEDEADENGHADVSASKDRKEASTPPFEPRQPFLFLAFFAHIHKFLFAHRRKTPTLQSIPTLRADDLTASTLLRWRTDVGSWSVDKRPALVWLLVYHFRWLLLGSQMFSLLSSFAVLAPPFFLQKILSWIAAKDQAGGEPLHVAMLYAFGLLLSRFVITWVQSGSLFLGRRLCARARSILITEILAKGLRRKEVTLRVQQSAEDPPEPAPIVDELDPSMPNGDAAHVDSGPTDAQKTAPKESTQPPSTASGSKDTDADDAKHAPIGKVVNLISTDVFRVSEIGAYLQFVFPEGPAQIVFTSIYLYSLLGPAALAGIAVLALAIPIQGLINRLWFRIQKKLMAASDKRLALATEVMAHIKLVKWFAWESNFMGKMNETRRIELRHLMQRASVFVVSGVVMMSVPTAVSIVTFTVHTKVFGQPLKAETAFTALALFNVLKHPLEMLADMIGNVVQCVVSLNRIATFLKEEETEKYATVTSSLSAEADDVQVGFENATFTYASLEDDADEVGRSFQLKDLNIIFPKGQLSLVVGKVGSGKTTLLLALLGEMNRVSGQVYLPSPISREAGLDPARLTATTAYCPQQPWLLSDTIQSNILFGSAMNEARYRAVLRVCALEPDLQVLDNGDLTEVGEKGTVLSGGQKARISLARAVYSPAKSLLLDDVLSAVDSHTAQHIFTHCLTGEVMKGRTCILVTHAVALCKPAAALVVHVDKGRIVSKEAGAADRTQKSLAEPPTALPPAESEATIEEIEDQGTTAASKAQAEERKKDRKKLIEEEHKELGAVSFAVYKLYLDAFGGWPIAVIAALFFLMAQGSEVALNWTLRSWAASYEQDAATEESFFKAFTVVRGLGELPRSRFSVEAFVLPVLQSAEDRADHYIHLYLVLGVVSMLLYAARMMFFMWRGVEAGRELYKRLIGTLFGARMRFFDSTPQGRIINRLSKDQQTIDQDLAFGLMFFAMDALAGTVIIVIIASVVPAFLIAAVFIAFIFASIGYLYLATAREVKRIESVTRSPVYALCSECLNGVTSIRAYGDTTRFMRAAFSMIDSNNQPFLTVWYCNRWLSVHIDITSALVVFAAAAFVVAQKDMTASLAGFTLTYAAMFSEKMLWIVRLWAFNEINFNSVERCREYLSIDQEAQGGMHPPAAWPSRSATIEVEKLTATYAPHLPPALREVSFVVQPGEKIGICGRTGSGKSTLASAFFRVIEPNSGRIVIDGLDISTLNLQDLRSRLAIIPQEAILFKGSVRWNLDPFSQYEDSQLWDALRRVGMASDTPRITPGPSRRGSSTNLEMQAEEITVIQSLNTEIQEGGKNLSTGQRQLLAIARAILKLQQTSILILDESTASLDSESDERIQQTIRQEMGEATILCIAHRLNTIIDYDKILCLGDGQVLEFDTPWNLLEREDSHFATLCRRSGNFDQLKRMAQQAGAATEVAC